MLEKQDSNQVGLYMAREVNGELPNNPVFVTREPNTFSRFGGDYKMVARSPISQSRQNKKGTVSDLDTAGEWNEDVTQNNMLDMLEGFFFATMREKAVQAVSSLDDDPDTYTVADGAGFPVGSIAFASGFQFGANNGAKLVTARNAGLLTVASALVPENIAIGANKTLTRVGQRFPAGGAVLTLQGGLAALTVTGFEPETLGLIPGEWVFVGGDAAATRFDDVRPFYARVQSIDAAANTIFFDKTTTNIPVGGDDGAGKTIELYFGFLVKNEDDPDLIVKSTFTLERPLGKDDDGTQSDNLQRYAFNTFKWNSPLANKVTADITGVGLGYETRTGAEGMLSKANGAVIRKALGEEAFNTSLNVFRLRLSMVDPETLNPSPLFARITEWTATINNGVTAAKAQGDLGGFDTNVGQFGVQLTMTGYFTTVAAIRAIEQNWDCTYDAIYAKENAAIIHDYPLIGLAGGQLTVAQNQPIMIPLTNDAAESPFGHTALINFFPYVPSVGMAKGG